MREVRSPSRRRAVYPPMLSERAQPSVISAATGSDVGSGVAVGSGVGVGVGSGVAVGAAVGAGVSSGAAGDAPHPASAAQSSAAVKSKAVNRFVAGSFLPQSCGAGFAIL